VVEARDRFAPALADMSLRTGASKANFVLAEPGGDDRALQEGLISRDFPMRPGSDLVGHLRITIGRAT
jgi:histidinol-phosphate/aromatic aminotransferase/cobyric acid decarboxylase-like protein